MDYIIFLLSERLLNQAWTMLGCDYAYFNFIASIIYCLSVYPYVKINRAEFSLDILYIWNILVYLNIWNYFWDT